MKNNHPSNGSNLNVSIHLEECRAKSLGLREVMERLKDLPREIRNRLVELWNRRAYWGGRVRRVGQILLARIIDFIQKHPCMTAGTALGIALAFLLQTVPFIGQIVGPLAIAVFGYLGAVLANPLDRGTFGPPTLNDFYDVARAYFQLFADLLVAAWRAWGQPQPASA